MHVRAGWGRGARGAAGVLDFIGPRLMKAHGGDSRSAEHASPQELRGCAGMCRRSTFDVNVFTKSGDGGCATRHEVRVREIWQLEALTLAPDVAVHGHGAHSRPQFLVRCFWSERRL